MKFQASTVGKRIGFEMTNAVTPFGQDVACHWALAAERLRMAPGSSGLGPCDKSEHGIEVACRLNRLDAEHWQVLSHVVAEDGAEDARG